MKTILFVTLLIVVARPTMAQKRYLSEDQTRACAADIVRLCSREFPEELKELSQVEGQTAIASLLGRNHEGGLKASNAKGVRCTGSLRTGATWSH